jgi:hypothetical protein
VLSTVLSLSNSPLVELLLLCAIALLAGTVGAMVGVGGGIFLVPALVLIFGIDIHYAIAASLVSVVGTSSGASVAYVWDELTDLKLAMFLETATVAGGLIGAIVTVTILASAGNVLTLAFVPVIVFATVMMARGRRPALPHARSKDPVAERLGLGRSYVDPGTGAVEHYKVTGTGIGLGFSTIAGFASGLLGIGGGVFKVPAMNAFMSIPLRVASATSTFMIGVTACASALVYFMAGYVSLPLVAPVAVAVMGGSFAGTHLVALAPARGLRYLFIVVLSAAAFLLLLKGAGWIA